MRGRRAHGWLWALWIHVFPLVAPWVLLYGVNAMPPGVPLARRVLPREPFRRDRCTWDCHNHGCRHHPKLPAVITDDRYVFGATIRGLYALGRLFSTNAFVGYGIANLLVFCALWPGLMYALWVLAWKQHLALKALDVPPPRSR